jgi:hypothetical protein
MSVDCSDKVHFCHKSEINGTNIDFIDNQEFLKYETLYKATRNHRLLHGNNESRIMHVNMRRHKQIKSTKNEKRNSTLLAVDESMQPCKTIATRTLSTIIVTCTSIAILISDLKMIYSSVKLEVPEPSAAILKKNRHLVLNH